MPAHNLAERRILKAQAEGVFDNLEGAGKPLPDRRYEDATAVALRMMAEAGVLPREFELKKQIDAQREAIVTLSDPMEREAALKKLAELQLRYDIEREARRRFYG